MKDYIILITIAPSVRGYPLRAKWIGLSKNQKTIRQHCNTKQHQNDTGYIVQNRNKIAEDVKDNRAAGYVVSNFVEVKWLSEEFYHENKMS